MTDGGNASRAAPRERAIDWRAPALDPVAASAGYDRGLEMAWIAQPEARARLVTAGGEPDWLAFALWTLVIRRDAFPVLVDDPDRLARWASQAMAPEETPADASLPLTRVMMVVWRARADLRAAFDPATGAGADALAIWCLTHGRREYPGLAMALEPLIRQSLAASAPMAPDDPPLRPSPFTLALARARFGAGAEGTANGGDGVGNLDQGWAWRHCLWLLFEGLSAFDLWSLAPEATVTRLLAPIGPTTEPGWPPATWLARALWTAQPDQHRSDSSRPDHPAIDPATPAGARALMTWHLTRAGRDGHPPPLNDAERALAAQLIPTPPHNPPPIAAPSVIGRHDRSTPGVDVLGCPRGEFGVAEDTRLIARALRVAGVSVGIVERHRDIGARMGDHGADDLIIPEPRHTVELLSMTPGASALDRLATPVAAWAPPPRHVIGCWHIELPECPVSHRPLLDLTDEIWAASRFAHAAWRVFDTPPVHHLPPPVVVPDTIAWDRADLGLPEGVFLFLYALDAGSNLPRKNPQAAIAAFQRAFPPGIGAPGAAPSGTAPSGTAARVGLVIKVMNAMAGDPAWEAVQAAALADPRILLIERVLDRDRVLALIAACDALISPHRAEGFGRVIAEAMALARPVICTAHSGNLDFTTPDTACLVAYRAAPIPPGAFPDGTGQWWAEVDIDHAAWFMRRLVEDPIGRRRLALAGRAHIRHHHSLAAAGLRYRARLEAMGAIPPLSTPPVPTLPVPDTLVDPAAPAW